MLSLLLFACNAPEPIELPADPSEQGAPVGVRTITGAGGRTLEVWYPASDRDADLPGDVVSMAEHVPAVFTDHVGDIDIPTIESYAIRDANLREPETPYPVIVFSHGFSGFRTQSVDYASHLASRGHVVVAADHYGRHLSEILPCLFLPTLEGCALGLGVPDVDPAHEDLVAIADWVERQATGDSWLSGRIDPERLGLTGHSAGGASTAGTGSLDARFDVLVPMGGSDVVSRDVPTRVIAGGCDGIFTFDQIEDNAATSTGTIDVVNIEAAGHMAFSDICALELDVMADEVISPREDANDTILSYMVDLATDGCDRATPNTELETCSAEAFMPLDEAFPAINGAATEFFEAEL